MPFNDADLRERLGSILIALWQTQHELVETQDAYEAAKLRLSKAAQTDPQ